MRLIDAEELKRKYVFKMWDKYFPDNTIKVGDVINQTLNFINDAPTEEEKTYGEWQFLGDNLWGCSECTFAVETDVLSSWKMHQDDTNFPHYCPNCGASMEVK